jgi:hypothetical protein
MNDVLVAREQLRMMIADSRAGDAASAVSLAGGMLLGWHGRRYVSKRRRVRVLLEALARSKGIRKAS